MGGPKRDSTNRIIKRARGVPQHAPFHQPCSTSSGSPLTSTPFHPGGLLALALVLVPAHAHTCYEGRPQAFARPQTIHPSRRLPLPLWRRRMYYRHGRRRLLSVRPAGNERRRPTNWRRLAGRRTPYGPMVRSCYLFVFVATSPWDDFHASRDLQEDQRHPGH